MPSKFLAAARELYDFGFSLIPIEPRGKRPLIPDTDPTKQAWEQFMHQRAPWPTVEKWFSNGSMYNLGAVHGAVSGNYIVIDIDGDVGVFSEIREQFPQMTAGRLVLSGSRKGYHIPIVLGELPDFGMNAKQGRHRGNRTWKTPRGSVNIRARYCQSLVPPSIHKDTGYEYAFIQDGPIIWLPDLSDFIEWLDRKAPQSAREAKVDKRVHREYNSDSSSLRDVALSAWSTLEIFKYFGLLKKGTQEEPDGNIRVLGNGGLLVDPGGEAWWCFEQDIGGGPIEAWGWQRFGYFNPKKHFRVVLIEMAWAAGVDVTRFTQKREELQYLTTLRDLKEEENGNPRRWTQQFAPQWTYSPTT